jgi:hypothetical protein
MQAQVNRITEPIENQTLEEVWETIKLRKEQKMDVTDILGGLNITRSYQNIIEEPRAKARVTHASPGKKTSPKKVTEKQSPSP